MKAKEGRGCHEKWDCSVPPAGLFSSYERSGTELNARRYVSRRKGEEGETKVAYMMIKKWGL